MNKCHIPTNVQVLTYRLVKSLVPRSTPAGQDDIEQPKSSFTETHLDHINMAKLEM